MKAVIVFSALLVLGGCNVLEPPVARSVDGVVTEGRFIEPEAYALYAVAALREARGQWADALATYQRALDLDERGPELRTRIGAVACKLGQVALADHSFADAQRAAPDYGPLWFELAQCLKTRGDLGHAESAALTALQLDPERPDASLLAADIAELRGNHSLAWQLRDGLAAHARSSVPVLRRLRAAAQKVGDEARVARMQARLDELTPTNGAPAGSGVSRALSALQRGDLASAQLEAQRLLGADPGHGDALVVALLVADLQQDQATFNALLTTPVDAGTPASPELLQALTTLLARRVSVQAAELVKAQP